ncbi:hypothetical protein [Olsenella sp. Marseille-P4559]|uniref:hypothetical protein n=1 Tax=Olsenella sp. Marseille-P4559 TaxID=2364795 RepID=UPI00102FBDFE|nr:hypothetical protein [Olsenella sp. Marseille-P4559]
MTRDEAFQEIFGIDDVTFDDVLEFANPHGTNQTDEERLDRLVERYGGSNFLPDYLSRLTGNGAGGMRSPLDVEGHKEYWSEIASMRRGREESHERRMLTAISTASRLIRLAITLLSTLQSDSHITRDTLVRAGIVTKDSNLTAEDVAARLPPRRATVHSSLVAGSVSCTCSIALPPSDYLPYLWEGVERSINPYNAIGADFIPSSADRKSPLFQRFGWVAAQSDANLFCLLGLVPNSEEGYRQAIENLLGILLDLHLNHVSQKHYGTGQFRFLSTDIVTALWVRLRESGSGGRVGFCRVCGKPFIATSERREKRMYCVSGGGCEKAYTRTKNVLARIEGGETPEEAQRNVGNISLKRVREIAVRNELFKDGFNYGI